MGARSSHNRVKDADFFNKGIEETIKKAKVYYRSGGHFYIKVYNNELYYADTQNDTNTAIKSFHNTARWGERANWVEEEIS